MGEELGAARRARLEDREEPREGLDRGRVLGPERPVVADTPHNMAIVHGKQGQHTLEAECFDKCVAIYAKVYGNEHSKTVKARNNAARARV